MAIEYINLEESKPLEKLQALFIGPEKGGKSWLAATAPKPVLFFDFDQRARSLAGRHEVYAMSFRDPAPNMQPTAFNEFLDVMTKLEQGQTLKDINPAMPLARPATVVLDSISTMAKSAGRYAMYTNQDVRRRLSFGSWSVDIQKNFDAWNAEMTTIENAVLRCLATSFHVIANVHECEEESETSTPENKKFTGRVGIYPARYQLLLKYFNEVWHVEQAPDPQAPNGPWKPRAQVKPDHRCPWAVTTLDLDKFEPCDIQGMLAKHLARHPLKATQQAQQTITKT